MPKYKTNNGCKTIFNAVLLTVVGFFIVCSLEAISQDHGHDHGHGSASNLNDSNIEGRAPIKRNLPFKGYGKSFTNIKKLCEAIAADGRIDILVSAAKEQSARDLACEACRPFMQAITQNCSMLVGGSKQPKTTKKAQSKSHTETETEGEEGDESVETTPTPTPLPYLPQREPSALTIDRAVRLFTQIADDKEIRDKTRVALQKLFFVLTDKGRNKPAAREYFSILYTYIIRMFPEPVSATANGGSSGGGSGHSPAQTADQLDALFE